MRVSFAGLELVNPVIAASGTFGYGIEFEEIVSLDRLGAIVTKGISLEPMAGHAPPRIVQTAAGMLNAIGLQNVGVEDFIERKLPPMSRHPSCKVIVNVFGHTVNDYIGVIDRLNDAEGIAAYELNASCPNVHEGGMTFGSDPYLLEELVERTKRVAIQPLIVKLSPNVTSIGHMARVCEGAGADAVSLVNTFLAMSIDANEKRPRLSNVNGRAVRSGDQADRAAHGVRSGAGREDSDSGDGRHCDAGRRGGVHAGRCDCGASGHGKLRRSARDRAAGEGNGIVVQEPRCGEGGKFDGGIEAMARGLDGQP